MLRTVFIRAMARFPGHADKFRQTAKASQVGQREDDEMRPGFEAWKTVVKALHTHLRDGSFRVRWTGPAPGQATLGSGPVRAPYGRISGSFDPTTSVVLHLSAHFDIL